MAERVVETGLYRNITATTTIMLGAGEILGIFVASASSTPTIKVQDSTTTIVNTFTPASATYYPIPFNFATSLIVTISGTVDCTVSWNAR